MYILHMSAVSLNSDQFCALSRFHMCNEAQPLRRLAIVAPSGQQPSRYGSLSLHGKNNKIEPRTVEDELSSRATDSRNIRS